MDNDNTGAALPSQHIDILWSARRAGTFLIVPRGKCADALAAMKREGYLRDHLGHVMLTPKGHEQRRQTSRLVYA